MTAKVAQQKRRARYIRACDHCGYGAILPYYPTKFNRCTNCGKPAAWFKEVLPRKAAKGKK